MEDESELDRGGRALAIAAMTAFWPVLALLIGAAGQIFTVGTYEKAGTAALLAAVAVIALGPAVIGVTARRMGLGRTGIVYMVLSAVLTIAAILIVAGLLVQGEGPDWYEQQDISGTGTVNWSP